MIFGKNAEQRDADFFLRKVRRALKQIAKGRKIASIYHHNDIIGIRGSVSIDPHGKNGQPMVQVVKYDSWIPLDLVYKTLAKEGYLFDPPSGDYNTPVDRAAGRDDMFILNIYLPPAS